ncbi:DNA mismatch repair protein muts, partial [Dimargaris cristalligena]
ILTIARQVYKETIDDVYQLVQAYCETYSMTIKLQFNTTTGFYLSCSTKGLHTETLDPVFINDVTKKSTKQFTTLEIIKLNQRINNALDEITLMSDKAIGDLLAYLRGKIGALHDISRALAELDLVLSFANSGTLANYVRPRFSNHLAVEMGRHPILDRAGLACVPNSVSAQAGAQFHCIMGAHRSGKTTYLKQIALL